MKYSRLFGKTLREAKRDMVFNSHKLLYQGGFVRELSAGRYEFLPLGLRVWSKMIELIDNEMESIGSQRMSIPILQPLEIWKQTNRDAVWGSSLMKIKDREGAEFALSATGEGVLSDMVGKALPSYKDLPIVLHQFIVKFRDEERPRGGLLRVREFVMKDAYSFDATEDDSLKTYQNFKDAYSRLCEQLGLEYYPVIADSGALGGDYCHEFQIPCVAGEDFIVKCTECDYAANMEKAEFVRKDVNAGEEPKEFEMIDLPTEVGTMKQLTKHYGLPAERFIKNVVFKKKDGTLVIATVTGDLDVDQAKLEIALGVGEDGLLKAEDSDLEKIGTKHGFVHSWGYEEYKDKIVFVADIGLTKAVNLYGGFKTETQDPINVNYGRDFESDIVADIASPSDGSTCAACGGKLGLIRSVEFGHIFKYDHFYSEKHDTFYINDKDEKKYLWMGAYGIGIGRAIAIVAEQHNDDHGIVWPITVAPYQIHLVTVGDNDEVLGKSEKLYEELKSAGYEVLWDERTDASAGVKFADADLIGCPVRIVVSSRSIKNGGFELKRRKDAEVIGVFSEDNIINKVSETVKGLYNELTPNTEYKNI